MWCLIILLVLILIGVVLEITSDGYGSDIALIPWLIAAIFAFMLAIAFPVSQIGTRSEIKQFHAYEATIAEARTHPLSEYELAAIIQSTAEMNQWLANIQYQNQLWDWFIPDEVDELKPLK